MTKLKVGGAKLCFQIMTCFQAVLVPSSVCGRICDLETIRDRIILRVRDASKPILESVAILRPDADQSNVGESCKCKNCNFSVPYVLIK